MLKVLQTLFIYLANVVVFSCDESVVVYHILIFWTESNHINCSVILSQEYCGIGRLQSYWASMKAGLRLNVAGNQVDSMVPVYNISMYHWVHIAV